MDQRCNAYDKRKILLFVQLYTDQMIFLRKKAIDYVAT